VKERLERIRKRIADAAITCGRDPDSVRLVAVSKTMDAERVARAIDAGADILGENYIQEARTSSMPCTTVHVRSGISSDTCNPTRPSMPCACSILIHSVDSFKLAGALDKEARKNGKTYRISSSR
jgi:uncharacterized pyridoxal phosphate-containing UPF0001 family protein